MFNTKHNECVGFESRWKVKKVYSVRETQTTEFAQTSTGTSTTTQKSIEVQTDPMEAQASPPEVDEEKLAAWLNRIYPQVKKELNDVATKNAFKGYRIDRSKHTDPNCKLVQTINVSSQLKSLEIGRYVSSMSWNATSQTLAVACAFKHTSLCFHEGFVLIYTLNRDDALPELPNKKLQIDEACVMCVQFHPVLPGVLVGGLFTGAIAMWNLQNGADELLQAKVVAQNDCITQLSWVANFHSPKEFLLASASLDGFLTLWATAENTLISKEAHQIKSAILPKADGDNKNFKKVIKGVLCFDFSKHKPNLFLIGAEGGLVVQCSRLGPTLLPNTGRENVQTFESISKYYDPHKGEITAISFSPNRSDMFLTCGTDLELRIYMIDQEEPAQIIFVKSILNCIRWVPYEEKIVVGCTNSMEIYHLIDGKLIADTSKDSNNADKLMVLQINPLKSNIVAAGTEKGAVQMWRVPWNLFVQ